MISTIRSMREIQQPEGYPDRNCGDSLRIQGTKAEKFK